MKQTLADIAIIGGGPAGLSAAVTARIRNKSVLLFEHLEFSPKLQRAQMVHNYLGLPAITGRDLMRQFSDHALQFKPQLIKQKVVSIFPGSGMFTLLTPEDTYEARVVILATGVMESGLLPGEKDLVGRGVSYCATCDGMLYRDQDVAVISYTQDGEHEAEYLAEFCRKVYYLPQYTASNLLRNNVKISAIRPRTLRQTAAGITLGTEPDELNVNGVFILRQSDPVETLLPGIELNGELIKVDNRLATNIAGVFAAGDCTGKPWQISRATGEGLVAALSAIEYLAAQYKTTAQ